MFHAITTALGIAVALVSSFVDARELTVDDRVAAQRAIEEVYWRHRIWPESNPGPKPPLSTVMSEAQLRSKVEDYLKKSNALDKIWRRPVTSAQLQAEMERMARETRAPETLRELFAALGEDPALIAETLVQQNLVERLIRNFYAFDDRIHGAMRRQAEAFVLEGGVTAAEGSAPEYRETTWVHVEAPGGSTEPDDEKGTIRLGDRGWSSLLAELVGLFDVETVERVPLMKWSGLREAYETFRTTAVLEKGADRMRIATAAWRKVPFDVWWRSERGSLSMSPEPAAGFEPFTLSGGGGCENDTWRPVVAPIDTRSRHSAVWTGAEMIVWGGDDFNVSYGSGGRYDPATDGWTATNVIGAPAARYDHTAVWTGMEMIVWGGADDEVPLGTGGRYDPLSDSWRPVSIVDAGGPRWGHTSVWTGTEMITWGGTLSSAGSRYDPSSDRWTSTSPTRDLPFRSGHTAVWTGTEMIVWGGGGWSSQTDAGSRYDPSRDRWTKTNSVGAPTPRSDHTAIWTGKSLIVWAGLGWLPSGYPFGVNTGAMYDPAVDTWVPTTTVGAPEPRSVPSAIWTGDEMIVLGGRDARLDGAASGGGRYAPETGTWTAVSYTGQPSERWNHAAIWTGSEMMVWGGFNYDGRDPFPPVGGAYCACATPRTVYLDADGDGFGDAIASPSWCGAAPAGHVTAGGDCNDADPSVHPGAGDPCNGIDDDCDGVVDEGATDDSDGDGVADCDDACPGSCLDPTVLIPPTCAGPPTPAGSSRPCDTEVPNMVLSDGCTIEDEIRECSVAARGSHGRFVKCVKRLSKDLARQGAITDRQRKAIDRCANRSKDRQM